MRKSKIKFIITIIVLIVMLGTATGVIGYYSNWFTNWDKFKIFPNNSEPNTDNDNDSNSDIDSTGGAFLNLLTNNDLIFKTTKIPRSKFSANGIADTADSAYELTATIQPSIAENKNVVWSARWNNSASGWGATRDVNNYLIFNNLITKSGEKVIVTFLKDFGEQIIITASAESNNSINAICTVDYKKKVDFVQPCKLTGILDVALNLDSNGIYRVDYDSSKNYLMSLAVHPVYTTYTIDEDFSFSYVVKFTKDFNNNEQVLFEGDLLSNRFYFPHSYNEEKNTFLDVSMLSKDDFFKKALNCNTAKTGIIKVLVKWSNNVETLSSTFYIGYTSSSLQAVTGIDIDKGEIII